MVEIIDINSFFLKSIPEVDSVPEFPTMGTFSSLGSEFESLQENEKKAINIITKRENNLDNLFIIYSMI